MNVNNLLINNIICKIEDIAFLAYRSQLILFK
jgi:hypothetical protein